MVDPVQDLFNTNLNSTAAANIAGANNTAALYGALIEGAGGIAGAAIMACWVAREVFGAADPRWMLFRKWLLTDAPPWFRAIYIGWGERFAGWLKGKDRIKSWIRRWMERRIRNMR